MKTAEKIARSRDKSIFTLHKEGLFYKCYNEDAMLFAKHIRPYKVTSKYVKSASAEVLSLGFPLREIENGKLSFKNISEVLGCEQYEETNGQVIFDLKNEIKQNFEVFRNSVIEKTRVQDNGQPNQDTSPPAHELILMIKNFDLANSTPMDGLTFIQQLKKEVQRIEPGDGVI